MLKCDIFVYSDDVQYPKQCYTNRVEIPIGKTPGFLTLPVSKGGDDRIADKRYIKDKATCSKLIKTLRINLGGLSFFDDLEALLVELEHVYWQYETVADLNVHMNQFIATLLGISTPVRRGTELGLESFHRNERLVQRCRLLGSGSYLCGQGADGYQDEALLAEAGVKLERIDYSIGRALFGDDLRFSIAHGIAGYGLDRVRVAVAAYDARNERH